MVLSSATTIAQIQPYILPLTLITLSYYVFRAWRTRQVTKLQVPIVGISAHQWFSTLRARLNYIQHGGKMILEGYQKHPDQIFQLPTVDQDLIVLPPRYIAEIKSLPEEVMSADHAVSDYFLGAWTTLDVSIFGPTLWHALGGQFIKHIGDQIEPLEDEGRFGFAREFSSYPDWEPVTIHPKILRMVARTTARLTVGPILCRNELWLETTIEYALCVFRASAMLKLAPSSLRSLIALFMPLIHRIRRYRRAARKILIPEILRRREEKRRGQENISRSGERDDGLHHKDTLEWLEEVSTGEQLEPDQIVHRMLAISFGAIHTTTNHIVNVVLDLATRWDEYGPELRQEIEQVVGSQMITEKTKLTRLSKMDSFMKESQRMNPSVSLTINRKLLAPHTFTDGTLLPSSTYIAVASGPMAVSPDYHDSPNTFLGFRFHNQRLKSDNQDGSHFSSTSYGTMNFGYGKFACPGRFFASMQSKMILVNLIGKYDLKLEEGQSTRPPNLTFADNNPPDPTAKILLRDMKSM